jgi:hypothetical protein
VPPDSLKPPKHRGLHRGKHAEHYLALAEWERREEFRLRLAAAL